MNTLSLQRLEKYLKAYSLDIDYWSNEMGDTDAALGSREIIEENRVKLTNSMLEQLSAADEKARATLNGYGGHETWDVKMLRKIVEIADGHQRKTA